MDFGAFIITAIVGFAFLVSLARAVTAYGAHHPDRHNRLSLSGLLAVVLLLCGIFLYKVFYLDEGVGRGDVARVQLLLDCGASPDATWEDGKSALQIAKDAHNDDLIAILKAAGAKE